MTVQTHEALYGLTAFRSVALNTDLAIPVIPADANGRKAYPRGLLLGTSGNVTLVGVDDDPASPVTLTNLQAGVWHPICAKIITATTGANLVVGY